MATRRIVNCVSLAALLLLTIVRVGKSEGNDKPETPKKTADLALRTEFLEQYPKAVAALHAFYERVLISGLQTDGTAPSIHKTEIEYATDGKMQRLRTRDLTDPAHAESVLVANPDLTFTLRRTSSDKPYEITDAARKSYGPTLDAIETQTEMVRAPFCLLGKSLVDLLALKGFTIHTVEKFVYQEYLYKAHFIWPGKSGERRGWFIVAPDRGWIITQSMVTGPHKPNTPKSAVMTTVKYGAVMDAIPLPKFITSDRAVDNTPQEKHKLEILSIDPDSVAAPDFTMTAYGVAWKAPEIARPAAISSYRLYYWGSGAVVLLMCLSGMAWGARSRWVHAQA